MAAGSTYTPIATTTLGSAAASVTFSSISGAYTDLVLIVSSASASSASYISLQYNGDTATNYSVTMMRGNGSTASSTRYASTNEIYVSVASINTTDFNNTIVQFENYSNTTTYKTNLTRANNASLSTDTSVGLWRNTAAITSIKVLNTGANFAIGSTFTLYGIAAA
jgi:hypothetical protein